MDDRKEILIKMTVRLFIILAIIEILFLIYYEYYIFAFSQLLLQIGVIGLMKLSFEKWL